MRRVHLGRTRPGFSLIELLVVIAIIAILAAMMFPVFAKAREKARTVVCASNMKQVAMALGMYAGDHGGRGPAGQYYGVDVFGNPGPINAAEGWVNYLYPYTRDTEIFRCPTTSSAELSPVMRNNYAYNYDLLSSIDVRRIDRPSETMALMDFADAYAIRGSNTAENFFAGAGRGIGRHNDGCNVAFCDGHVKRLPEGAVRGEIPNSGQYSVFLGYTIE